MREMVLGIAKGLLVLGVLGVEAFVSDCNSPYWLDVRRNLRGGPDFRDIVALVERGAADPEGSECHIGRFLLSIWQLIFMDPSERAVHLQNNFGAGFFDVPWTAQASWPLFSGLAELRRRVLSDPRGTHVASTCDASEDGLKALHAAFETNVLPSAVLASKILLRMNPEKDCPIAIAAAFCSLAVSLGRDGEDAEVQLLLRAGEDQMKTWAHNKGNAFLETLTTAWPLWRIMGDLEQQGKGTLLHGVTATPSDPRDPNCPPTNRSLLIEGLDRRVVAIVVYGRRERVKILHRYLQRNLRANGGVIDEVSFVVLAATQLDLEFLSRLVAMHPEYNIPPVNGRRLAKIYSVCTDPNAVYVKIDDDIVFMSDAAVPDIVRERLRARCSFVSANVVNHAILSAIHQDIGAVRTYYMDQRHWVRHDEALPMAGIDKKAQSDCVWKWWECGAWMHESLLSRLADGTACAYDFGWHDFHAHGYGVEDGERLRPFPFTRWSINMMAFTAADVWHANQTELAEDDEHELAVMVPWRTGTRACAVGRALVAHFSYSRQEDGMLKHTDLLHRYSKLSLSWD